MARLDVIKERLERYTSEATNTDEKLENGAISDWTFHGDEDMAWLVERVSELVEALDEVLKTGLNGGNNVRLAFIAASGRALEGDSLRIADDSERAVRKARAVIAKARGE